MDRIVDREDNGYILITLGEINGWTEENDKGRIVVELCAGSGM